MHHRLRGILLIETREHVIKLKDEYCSFSSLNKFQRLELFINTHISWRFQFFIDTAFKKSSRKEKL